MTNSEIKNIFFNKVKNKKKKILKKVNRFLYKIKDRLGVFNLGSTDIQVDLGRKS